MDIRDLPVWMEKEASLSGLLQFFKLKVPNALVLYALLGALDLGFSKMAFSVGIATRCCRRRSITGCSRSTRSS